MNPTRSRARRHLGDFQTPLELARAILATLKPPTDRWTRILEPTCGTGAFLRAALETLVPGGEVIGVEIDRAHCSEARSIRPSSQDASLRVVHANFFDLDLRRDLHWTARGPILVVGNPPWVTTAELGRLESQNRPRRRNVRSLPGLEAMTGASNFDLGEAVWIKLLEELADERPTIALLCKTTVARSVLEFVRRSGLEIANVSLREIDASRWFGASVRAGVLRLDVGLNQGPIRVPVYPGLEDPRPRRTMEFRAGRLIADAARFDAAAFALGTSPIIWRQGLKHDAAAVMELVAPTPEGPWRNGPGESVEVESEFVFPLLKGGDLGRPPADRPCRSVIVTQRRLGEPTHDLASRAPRLWAYLQRYEERFRNRRSSIYRGKPPFALFGVGPYSFAHWKVAVSGLHRSLAFRLVGPVQGRPVMLDDTCYLLPCESPAEAAVLAALCGHRHAIELIEALSFPGAKRPVTKGVLQRVDLSAILERADRRELLDRAEALAAGAMCEPGLPRDCIGDQIAQLGRRFRQTAMCPGPCTEETPWPSPGSTTSAVRSRRPAP